MKNLHSIALAVALAAGSAHAQSAAPAAPAGRDLSKAVTAPMVGTVYLSPAPLYHAGPLRWSMLVQRLGGDYRIVTLDLPGHGLTGGTPDKDYGEHWKGFLDRGMGPALDCLDLIARAVTPPGRPRPRRAAGAGAALPLSGCGQPCCSTAPDDHPGDRRIMLSCFTLVLREQCRFQCGPLAGKTLMWRFFKTAADILKQPAFDKRQQ